MTIAPERPPLTTDTAAVELARINTDLAAVEAKMDDPQGWASLLEDQRSVLLNRRAVLLAGRVDLTATTMLGA